jgi:hypothetical protein
MTPLEITTSTESSPSGRALDHRVVQRDVRHAHLPRARLGALEHRRRHVDGDGVSGRAGHLRGDEQVGPRAATEVEHRLTGLDAAEQPVVGHSGEALDGRVRNARQLRLGVAELLRPGATRGEDELAFAVRRDVDVGRADLRPQHVDVDRYARRAHGPSSVTGARAGPTAGPA